MNEGFLGFKAFAFAAVAMLAVMAIIPTTNNSQFSSLRSLERPLGLVGSERRFLPKKAIRAVSETLASARAGPPVVYASGVSARGQSANYAAGSYPELSMIPSNFNINDYLVPAAIPGSNAPDVVGAFRFICGPGQVLADDPIVFPNQPGASHLHQFYGNTGANAYSTYSSLRQTGDSTCMAPLNRSGYWMPAMLDGTGNVVRPDYVTIYYKRRPDTDPVVSDPTNPQYEGKAIPLPNGLRYTFGFNMLTGVPVKITQAYFNCDGPTGVPGTYPDLPTAFAHCPAGNRVGAMVQAPECWDGQNLDSPDHHSHVAYPDYGSWGYLKCDSGHPYVIPHFTLAAWYSILPGDDTSKWSLSSDAMYPGHPAGYTLHADWFGAWDNNTMSMWTDNCINKMLNCSGGNLGNGYMMKMYSGFSWTANPRLVPIPT